MLPYNVYSSCSLFRCSCHRIPSRNMLRNSLHIILSILMVKDTLNAFNDFKNKQKSVWSNVFWYVKVCVFWKCVQYNIHWDKTEILKKFPSDKINGTKNVLFFISRVPTHHSCTFDLRFLYELKLKVRLSKTVRGIFYFRFRYVLYLCSTKCIDSLFLKHRNSFQN